MQLVVFMNQMQIIQLYQILYYLDYLVNFCISYRPISHLSLFVINLDLIHHLLLLLVVPKHNMLRLKLKIFTLISYSFILLLQLLLLFMQKLHLTYMD